MCHVATPIRRFGSEARAVYGKHPGDSLLAEWGQARVCYSTLLPTTNEYTEPKKARKRPRAGPVGPGREEGWGCWYALPPRNAAPTLGCRKSSKAQIPKVSPIGQTRHDQGHNAQRLARIAQV